MANSENQSAASSTDAQRVTEADTPFDHADADFILRSSDNVDFRVFKLFLSFASPFFKAMFALPQANEGGVADEIKDGLPVIQVTEGRKVLEMLLLMCYPVDPPALERLEDVDLLLEAAIKYNAERVEKKAREILVGRRFLSADPMRVFAIACRYRLEEEARAAARATLTVAILERPYEQAELDSFISAGKLYRLLQYHNHCIAAAREASDGFIWPLSLSKYQYCSSCRNSFSHRSSAAPSSASGAMAAILRNRLPDQTDFRNIFMGMTNFPKCPFCPAPAGCIIPPNVGELTQQFFDLIDNAVSTIHLPLQL